MPQWALRSTLRLTLGQSRRSRSLAVRADDDQISATLLGQFDDVISRVS